ncbi:MAG: sulfotransferase [Pseudomonadales bacterium]|nr:sulfotransferase [Pseudomonadales bacterium]
MLESKKENSERPSLIYILSPSFSGSTLLTMMLAQHPRISTIGELKATAMGSVDEYSCSCGEKLLACNFWRQLSKDMAQQGEAFSLSNFGTHFGSRHALSNRILGAQVRGGLFEFLREKSIALIPSLAKEYQQITQKNRFIIEKICGLQKGDLFLDGSKDPQRLLYYQASGLYNIYVIRMFRNGRAQCHSRRLKPRNPVDHTGAVKEWVSTIKQMDYLVQKFADDKVFTFQYEQLCAQTGSILDQICSWLSIDPLSMDWSNINLKQSEHHIVGNRMRNEDSIVIRLDEKWRNSTTPSETQVFDSLGQKTNRQIGYS